MKWIIDTPFEDAGLILDALEYLCRARDVDPVITVVPCEQEEEEECPRCNSPVPRGEVQERYSYTVYAGKFCDACCYGYNDHCGLDGAQGDPQKLDEPLEPDWPSGF